MPQICTSLTSPSKVVTKEVFGNKAGPLYSPEHLIEGTERIPQGRETEASGDTVGFCMKCLSPGVLGVNHLPEVEISTSPSLLHLSSNKESWSALG